MYINFKYMKEKDISIDEVIFLQMAKQQRYEDLGHDIRNFERSTKPMRNNMEIKGLIRFVKESKGIIESRIRITPDGDKFLSNIETPEVLEQDLILFEWVKKVYKERGKKIGNMKKTKMYIALFRTHSGINKNRLVFLIKKFLEHEDSQKFSHVAEYVFFKPPSAYSTKFDLEESKLWKFYVAYKEHFDEAFKTVN